MDFDRLQPLPNEELYCKQLISIRKRDVRGYHDAQLRNCSAAMPRANASAREVYRAAPAGGKYEAKVTFVDQVIHAVSGAFRVRLIPQNPHHKLPEGLKCALRLPAH
jgi:hypothetical protein